MALNDDNVYSYKLPKLLWELIKIECHFNEYLEIKNLIGANLIEQSSELHTELVSLLDIWNMCHENVILKTNKSLSTSASKNILINEIRLLVEDFRRKTNIYRNREYNWDSTYISSNHILNSSSTSGVSSKCSSSATSLPSYRTSTESPINQLNFDGMDDTICRFRELFEEEIDNLLRDINYVRESLENEVLPITHLNDSIQIRNNEDKVIIKDLPQPPTRSAFTTSDASLINQIPIRENTRKLLNPIKINTEDKTIITSAPTKPSNHLSTLTTAKSSNVSMTTKSIPKEEKPKVKSAKRCTKIPPPFSTHHVIIQTKKPIALETDFEKATEVDYEINNNCRKSTSAQKFRNMVKESRQLDGQNI